MDIVEAAKEAFARIRRPPQAMYNSAQTQGSAPPKYKAVREHVDEEDDEDSDNTQDEANPTGDRDAGTRNPATTQNHPRSPGSESALSSRSSSTLFVESDNTNNVYESKFSLLPACAQRHGNLKGKGRASEYASRPYRARLCGDLHMCHEAHLEPAAVIEPAFELRLNDPQGDLRRWFTTANRPPDGKSAEYKSIDYLQDEKFTESHFLDALAFALAEIRTLHHQISAQVSYGRRFPLAINFASNVAPEAAESYLTMDLEHFKGAPMHGLRQDLVEAALEIDYLGVIAEDVERKIVEAKIRRAKLGGMEEIEAMVRLGVVDEEWVRKECCLTA